MPDFNAPPLGSGKEIVKRLANLIAVFETALNFSKSRAEQVDVLGDAYEYLMRHFAVESGKSKGQRLTPRRSDGSSPRSSASALPRPAPTPRSTTPPAAPGPCC